jgi:hypothetical protein
MATAESWLGKIANLKIDKARRIRLFHTVHGSASHQSGVLGMRK